MPMVWGCPHCTYSTTHMGDLIAHQAHTHQTTAEDSDRK